MTMSPDHEEALSHPGGGVVSPALRGSGEATGTRRILHLNARDIYTTTTTKYWGEMCLLMFACLPVHLFICLFIIWTWLFKLFTYNSFQTQTNSFLHRLVFTIFIFFFYFFVFGHNKDGRHSDGPNPKNFHNTHECNSLINRAPVGDRSRRNTSHM